MDRTVVRLPCHQGPLARDKHHDFAMENRLLYRLNSSRDSSLFAARKVSRSPWIFPLLVLRTGLRLCSAAPVAWVVHWLWGWQMQVPMWLFPRAGRHSLMRRPQRLKPKAARHSAFCLTCVTKSRLFDSATPFWALSVKWTFL